MQDAAPQMTYVPSVTDDLDLTATGSGDYNSITVSLHRAFEEFDKTPADRDAILGRWVAAQLRLLSPRPHAREDIVPMIKDRAWLSYYHAQYQEPIEPGSARDALYDEINSEFLVAYASFGHGILYLHVSDLAKMGITREELRVVALANLRARTPERKIDVHGGVWTIAVGGNFDSALMLDEETWRHPGLARLDPIVIAAPERDYLIAATGDSPGEILHMAFVASSLSRGAAYPISPRLMIRRDGRFHLLDPETKDDGHPIPNLDLIDVTQTSTKDGREITSLGIVVASPLGSDPRSVYRLFRKFEVYLAELGCDGSPSRLSEAEEFKPRIYLFIHPDSDSAVMEQLDWFANHVSRQGATLKVHVETLAQ